MAYPSGVNFKTTSVTSTTVPVLILPAGFMARGFAIKNRTTSANHCLIWAFSGSTTPNAVPANVRELAIGESLPDNITATASGADDGLGWGWAAVLETAGSATVDSVWS